MYTRLLIITLLALIVSGCGKTKDIGSNIILDDNKESVISALQSAGLSVIYADENPIKAYGEIELLGFQWDEVACWFEDDKLDCIVMSRPIDSVDMTMRNYLDTTFEDEYGDYFASEKHQMKVFGSNKSYGYCASYKQDYNNNKFMVAIKKNRSK